MRVPRWFGLLAICIAIATFTVFVFAQGGQGRGAQGAPADQQAAPPDPIGVALSRLTLDNYKATLKGLTQFGDRRQGTQRNRDAVAWIEAQLKSYGCQTERMTYL